MGALREDRGNTDINLWDKGLLLFFFRVLRASLRCGIRLSGGRTDKRNVVDKLVKHIEISSQRDRQVDR